MSEVAIVPTELEAATMAVKALKFERDSLKRERDELAERAGHSDALEASQRAVTERCDAMQAVVDAARHMMNEGYYKLMEGTARWDELGNALAAYDKEPTDGD